MSARRAVPSCVDTETLLVDAEVVRGDLPDPFVVRDESGSPGGASAFRVGAEVGLVAYERESELLVNECGLVPPERLRQARDEGWPRGTLSLGQRRLVARGSSTRVRVGCFGRCDGTVVLRAKDGARLGQARVDLRHGIKRITLRLSPVERRRLARDARLPVEVVVRLRPARSPVIHRSTLMRRRG